MNTSKWKSALLRRFGDRENLDREELYARHWAHYALPKREVFEALDLIELEYGIPSGVLRPEDELSKLLEPVPTR